MLIVTFTNAAASQMREKILNAIYKKLEEDPFNEHLKKQTVLINKANISTIHSFCLEIIRNNFFEIDISANFKIGDSTQLEILKQEAIENVFEQKYLNKDEEFDKLLNCYTNYRSDDNLKEMVLKIYKFIQSSPFPEEWLEEKVEQFNLKDKLEEDFSNTLWGNIILENFKEELEDLILRSNILKNQLQNFDELSKFYQVVCSDINIYEDVLRSCNTWEQARISIQQAKDNQERWPTDKKVTLELKDIAKETRKKIKDDFGKVSEQIMLYSSKEANEDIFSMYEILKNLQNIICEFGQEYAKLKKENNVIDFNDIEHFALNILVKKENGKYIPTDVAKNYQEKLVEIAIDEYQDSNLIQEYILNTISKGNNIFMVGDVKQSIYKFRQARPELFLEKYNTYNFEKEENNGVKIKLFKNFRSRKNVLEITNQVFNNIMSKKLGDIDYNEEEFLNLGADYKDPEEKINYAGTIETHIIDINKEEPSEEPIENTEIEAKFVADKIEELLNSNYMVYENGNYRKITYKDIVILLRSANSLSNTYEKEITKKGYPVYSEATSEYLDSYEINTIMSILKIVDNPNQDIDLVSVLRSPIYSFTDDELIEIRTFNRICSFYEVLKLAKEKANKALSNKINLFLEQIEDIRVKQEYMPIDELIWYIYSVTGFYNYSKLLPNGNLRTANLRMLFEQAKKYEQASFKGLYNFISFINKVKKSNSDLGSAKIIGENDDVIRIMSIHKSKGLEFPVVFLSSTGKKLNMQDLNESILIHQQLGFGPKYINYERKIEYNTLAKEALKIKSVNELISEEMRVLYVALTRAKEKLIITGTQNEADKETEEKEEIIRYSKEKLKPQTIKKYKSYLDWIQLVYLKNKEELKDVSELQIHKQSEINLKDDEDEKQDIIQQLNENNVEVSKKTNELIQWEYERKDASNIVSKTSVTQLKNLNNNEEEISSKCTLNIPKFLIEEDKITSAQIGTIMHFVLQQLDFKTDYDINTLDELIEQLVYKNLLKENEKKYINKKKILSFLESNLAKSLKQAKQLYKETPFYINIKANEIYDTNIEDNILVQGIIDLYYINKDDEIILVDYKTDYVENDNEEMLIKKYENQINIYARAIEEATNKKVSKKIIYSLYLNKEIQV